MTRLIKKSRSRRSRKAESATSCVVYVRESFHRRGQEKFSLDVQQAACLQYAAQKGLAVLQVYRETKSGWKQGRPVFKEMLRFLGTEEPMPAVIATHLDRTTRNAEDFLLLRQLGVERHMVSEGAVVSSASTGNDRLMDWIRAGMAEAQAEQISDRVYASMRAKAEKGLHPSWAPAGYVNVTRDGRKLIEPHEVMGPLVTELFERYSTGRVGLNELEDWAEKAGLLTHRGNPIHLSSIHTMLSHRVYCGDVQWDDVLVEGRHEPLVSRAVFERVQGILKRRRTGTDRRKRHEWLFQGLIQCACGRTMSTFTVKKKSGKEYTYLKCSRQNKKRCGTKPAAQRRVEAQVIEQLARLNQNPDALRWMQAALIRSLAKRKTDHERQIERLRKQHDGLGRRIRAAYEDHVTRLIDNPDLGVVADVFEEKQQQWAQEQAGLRAQLDVAEQEDHEAQAKSTQIFKLAAQAPELWKNAHSDSSKRDLLGIVSSNSVWDGTQLVIEFAEPFSYLALLAGEGAGAGPGLARLAEGSSEVVSRRGIEPRTRRLRVCCSAN